MLNLGYNLIFIDPTPLAVKYFKKILTIIVDKDLYSMKKACGMKKQSLILFFRPKADINSDEYIINNTISNYNKSKIQ